MNMTNKKIKELYSLEVIALASTEFKHDRFTGSIDSSGLLQLYNLYRDLAISHQAADLLCNHSALRRA